MWATVKPSDTSYHQFVDLNCERRRAALQFVALFTAAALCRYLLADRFYGWEEGDYGNLMMIREVIDSHFTWFRTAHMPGWYSMAALLSWTSDDPRASALAMTLLFSSLNVALAGLLARKLLSPAAGWLAGLWLVFQPEMALYGASTLRSPVFTSLAFLAMAFLIWGARVRGFGLTSLAFLVRMEAFFSFYVPALWSWMRDHGQGLRRIGLPLVLLFSVVVGWQAYISLVQERCLGVEFNLEDIDRCWESLFILGPVVVNLAPDVHGSSSGFDLWSWVQQGLATAWVLLSWTLPRKLSWVILSAAAVGLWALLRGEGRPGSATIAVYAVFTLGIWLLEGFLAHHDPNHNLYWVWLLPAIPFLTVLGAAGWFAVDRRLAAAPRVLRMALFAAVLLGPAPSFMSEAQYQMDRSERWYRPQLELSRWMEETLPKGSGVLVSSIPEVWLKRQDHGLRVYSWWGSEAGAMRVSPEDETWVELLVERGLTPEMADELVQRARHGEVDLVHVLMARLQGDPELSARLDPTTIQSDYRQQMDERSDTVPWDEQSEAVQWLYRERVGRFLEREHIQYVLWFQEDWTEAPTIAPFLGYRYDARGSLLPQSPHEAGPVILTPVDRTPPMPEGYGWVLYVVTRAGDTERLVPPRFGAGEKGPGWG